MIVSFGSRMSVARKEPAMQVRMDSETAMGSGKAKGKGKRRRPDGVEAATPRQAARAAKEDLCRQEGDWLDQLAGNPASFAEVEREVHAQMRRHADLFVAGLLAQASERAEMGGHVEQVLENAETPLRAVEKKDVR